MSTQLKVGEKLPLVAHLECPEGNVAAASTANKAVGIALTSEAAAAEVCYACWGEVVPGVLVGATAGTRYYWDGSALTSTIPSTSGQYVWQVGIAKNATDLLATVEFVKKNT